MMRYYVADAFTDELFRGNPAGVYLLDSWLEESCMQSIAAENNLPETAFTVPGGNGYELCWFTPETEIDLCGHAALAGAFILSRFVDGNAGEYLFQSKSGPLTVRRKGGLFELDFPSRPSPPPSRRRWKPPWERE